MFGVHPDAIGDLLPSELRSMQGTLADLRREEALRNG